VILLAAAYALGADIVATFLAASVAVVARRRVSKAAVGTALGVSGGFILGVAFLDLIPEAQQSTANNFIVALGVALGLLLMIGLEKGLGVFGVDEEEDADEEKSGKEPAEPGSDSTSERSQRAGLISIGISIHNVPEALPIGAAMVISPSLSLLVALLMIAETFAESGSIAGELVQARASTIRIFALTMLPSVFSGIGAPIGEVLAGSSPVLLSLTLSLAVGVMLFITGELWSDSRRDAGVAWSSVGLLIGVMLALLTSMARVGSV
jgi:ZIP family zinc transporter